MLGLAGICQNSGGRFCLSCSGATFTASLLTRGHCHYPQQVAQANGLLPLAQRPRVTQWSDSATSSDGDKPVVGITGT